MSKAISSSKLFILIGLILTLLQMLFDVLNVAQVSNETKMYIGAIGMFLAIISAGFKQYFDPAIPNFSIWIQIILFLGFISGALLEKFDSLDFLGEEMTSILRVSLTFISTSMPIIIKTIEETE